MKITRYPKQNTKTEFIGSSWTGLNQGYQRTLDSTTSYSDGRYTITMPGENQLVFANQTGASAAPLIENTHYQYEKRMDASTSEDATDGYGTIAGGVMDVSTSGNLDTGKLFRVVHGNYNIVSDFQPSGELKVYAKDLGVNEYTPSPDRVYLDPKTGKMIFPRPIYMNRCSNISTVDYPDIKSHLTPTSSIHSYTYTSSGVNGNAYMLYRVANQGGSYTSYINPFTGNILASDFVASFWAYNAMWNRNKDNNTGYAGQTLFYLNENTYIGKYCYSPNNVETYRHVVVINGTAMVDSAAGAGWYHFFVSSDGTTTKFYFNSTLVYTHTGTITLSNPYFVMWVATTDAGSHDGYVYTGLDNIKIWETAYSYEAAMLAIEYNSGAGNETALHPRYGLENNYIPNVKVGFNYIPNSVTNAVLPKPTGSNQIIQLQDIADYANGVGYFNKNHIIYKPNYTLPVVNTDFYYDEAIDGSGAHAKDIYDDSTSGAFATGKYLRVVSNGKNLTDATGLNLVPVAKSMSTNQYYPPATQFYIDPLRGMIVIPRPIYWSKNQSLAAMTTLAEINDGFTYYNVNQAAGFNITSGKVNPYCLRAQDTNDDLTIVHLEKTVPITKGSLCFWANYTSSSSSFSCYVGLFIGSDSYIQIVDTDSMSQTLRIVINSSVVASITQSWTDWTHFMFTWEEGIGLNAYVNGVLKLTYAYTGSILMNRIRIYANSGTSTSAATYVDNIKIWQEVFTDSTFDYNSGNGLVDTLHPIYGATNGYKPTLTSPGGVGFYKASGAGDGVRGTI